MLGCNDMDYIEHNISDMRGIDTARDIIASCQFEPLYGDVRVIVLDECFARGTTICSDKGIVPIENIQIGDKVQGMGGFCKVKNTFKNTVPINRVVKINFNDGRNIICSEDHLFFTPSGEWVPAKNLKKYFTFGLDSSIMGNILKQGGLPNGRNETLRMVPSSLFDKIPLRKDEEILFSSMCGTIPGVSSPNKKGEVRSRENTKDERGMEKNSSNNEGSNEIRIFLENVRKQPFSKPNNNGKNYVYQTIERNPSYLEGEKGREWKNNRTPNFVINISRMGNRSSDPYRTFFKKGAQFGISSKLQSGYRKYQIENSDRSGRAWAQWERSYIERQKEGGETKRIGVESIEIYQSGNNDESFRGIISNKERNQGYVEFYDLEIDGHPSYFANGILAHNCHTATKDFQHAMLKILEEPPKGVYFILCTTEPEKLLNTIKTRSTIYTVSPLRKHDMISLVNWILESEGVQLSEKVKNAILFSAEGCARKALVILDQIIDIKEEEKQLEAINENTPDETTIIELCRKIMAKEPGPARWKELSIMLKNIEQEPESVRRAILGYLSSVLINGNHDNGKRVAQLISEFSNNYYDCGKAGLISSVYLSTLI